MKFWRQFLTLAVLSLTGAGALSGQQVTAQFQPEIVSVGDIGAYAVTFSNFNTNRIPDVPPPSVPGLSVISVSPQTSQRTSIINGRRSSEVSFVWQVAAGREGQFTVPGRQVVVDGRTHEVPAATLRVVPASERNQGMFDLAWELPEKSFYVGESIPVLLKLYARADLRVGRPNTNLQLGDGLVATAQADEYEVTRETVGGINYNVVIWSLLVTPIRPGAMDLEATTEVLFEDPNNPQYSTDFFFRSRVQDRKLLATGPRTVNALEVPTTQRPAGFNGALGNFEIEGQLDPTTVQAGEPLTLKLSLEGTGNFERIAAPEIPTSAGWRAYPPKVTFEAEDELGFKGRKTFDYILIPADESITATPEIPFAVFNPYSEQFSALSFPPQAVTITPAPERSAAISFAGDEAPRPRARPQSWRSLRADLGATVDGVRPAFHSPLFRLLNAALGLAALLLWVVRWRRQRLSGDEAYARRVVGSKAVREWMKTADEAARAGEAEAFFAAAQRTVQEAVGRHFPRSRRATSLTLAEILEKLESLDLEATHRDEVTTLFEAGDALRYAGASHDASALRDHADRLVAVLRAIPS